MEPFSNLSSQTWAKMNFPRKKMLCQFLNMSVFNYLPLWKKSEKTNDLFLEKMPTDRQTDRQTNR